MADRIIDLQNGVRHKHHTDSRTTDDRDSDDETDTNSYISDSPQPRLVRLANGHRVGAMNRTRHHLPSLHHGAGVHAVILLQREISHLPPKDVVERKFDK